MLSDKFLTRGSASNVNSGRSILVLHLASYTLTAGLPLFSYYVGINIRHQYDRHVPVLVREGTCKLLNTK